MTVELYMHGLLLGTPYIYIIYTGIYIYTKPKRNKAGVDVQGTQNKMICVNMNHNMIIASYISVTKGLINQSIAELAIPLQ